MNKIIIMYFICCFFLITESNLFGQCCNFTPQQQFEPSTSAATFGVALGDLDKDGDLDAAVISAYYGIDVYFNNGAGSYSLSSQYAVGSDFYGVHIADVDGDDDLDIIGIPFYSSTNITILKNDGTGIFGISTFSSNISTYNAAVGDIDKDGDVDIFLPNAGGGSGVVYKNNGTGTFSISQYLNGARGHDVALGDIDSDGDMDAFVTENGSYANTVFLNDGAGNFTQAGANFGTAGGEIALGDLDGDGDADAWVGTSSDYSEIWLNNGSGLFSLSKTVSTGYYCKAVNLYDYDGDGDLDVFLGFYSSNPQVWINKGDLSFTLCYQATVGSSCHGQVLGDMNGDGKIDIYSGGFSNDDGDIVFLNNGITTASISYPGSPFCSDISTLQNVTQAGAAGGTYSSAPAGLTINNTNGAITPNASTPGTYTVTYTVGSCKFTTTVTVNIPEDGVIVSIKNDTLTSPYNEPNYWYVTGSSTPVDSGSIHICSQPGNYFVTGIDFNGCIAMSDTVFANCTTTGITSATTLSDVQIYPNPASDYVTVDYMLITGSHATIRLYDEVGNLIKTIFKNKLLTGSNSTVIETSEINNGIYFIELRMDDRIINRKLIITK